MDTAKIYNLTKPGYDDGALAPVISADLSRRYHDKHHAAYVNGANIILQKMNKIRLHFAPSFDRPG
jgi:Fe-Mn family superoxide dismutase